MIENKNSGNGFENLSSFSFNSTSNDPIEEKDDYHDGSEIIQEKCTEHHDEEWEIINVLLEGENLQVKNRVLKFILKADIKLDDKEFFHMFIVLGWVHSMLIDAPEKIKRIFKSIVDHLLKWEETNLKILQQLAEKTENMAILADSSVKLTNSLSELIELCAQLSQRLSYSEKKQVNSKQHWETLKAQLSQTQQNIVSLQKYVEQISISLTHLASQPQNSFQIPSHKVRQSLKKNWKGNFLIVLCIINFFLSFLTLGVVWSRQ